MREDDGVYVGYMLDLSRKVAAKIRRVRREEFDEDENLRLALAHLLQTIGEAARRVSRKFQEAHAEIPWAGIVGMRHKVAPDYTFTKTPFGRPRSRRSSGSLLLSNRWWAYPEFVDTTDMVET